MTGDRVRGARGDATEEVSDPITEHTDYAIYVVTTADESRVPSGCLVGFVTQCSIRPARFLVCISKENHTFDVVERSAGMALHLLGAEQIELASLFGEVTGDEADKFTRCRWDRGTRTSSPILRDCAAWLECLILDRFDVGDHRAHLVEGVCGGVGNQSGVLTFLRLPELSPGHPAG